MISDRYSIVEINNSFIIHKDNKPLVLSGVGVVGFSTMGDARDYINRVIEADYYIRMGVPE